MEKDISPPRIEPWMRGLLLLAGAYNVGWGVFIYAFPQTFYQWITQTTQETPWYIEWQGIGVLAFGLAYILAAIYPIRLWWIIGLGFFSKLIGAIGFYFVVMQQIITKKYIFHLLMNDLVWLIPLGIILIRVMRVRRTQEQPV